MNIDPRVVEEANHICHVVAESEGLERLNDKSRSDVFMTCKAISEINKKSYDDAREAEWLYNELKIWIRSNHNASREDILQIILHQEMHRKKKGIRQIRAK